MAGGVYEEGSASWHGGMARRKGGTGEEGALEEEGRERGALPVGLAEVAHDVGRLVELGAGVFVDEEGEHFLATDGQHLMVARL